MEKLKTQTPVAVVGPGALGGLLGALLARAGRPVLLVGRDRRWLARIRREGLRASGPLLGSAAVLRASPAGLFPVVRPRGPRCGAVFFCVKSYDTRSAIARSRALVGPQTAVVSLQNGLTHRRHYLAAFGKSRTVFGASFVAADRPRPLRVRHQGGRRIVLAARPENQEALRKAEKILKGSRLLVSVVLSEEKLLWAKSAFNAATNPLGALTGRTNGELAAIPALRELMLRALKEAVSAARASGHPVSYPDLESRMLRSLRAMPRQPNSMLQDLRTGRPCEIDAILAPFLKAARKKRVPVPTLETFHRLLRRLELELRR